MKKWTALLLALLLAGLTACGVPATEVGTAAETAEAAETTETADSAETAEPADSAETGDSAETADSTEATGSDESAEAAEAAEETDPVAQVTELLEAGGYTAVQTDSSSENVMYNADSAVDLMVQGQVASDAQGGEAGTVTVFLYGSAEAAETAAQGFDPEDPSLYTTEGENPDESVGMIVDYIAPITLYRWENAIVLYCGEDEGVTDLLTQGLGDAFATTAQLWMETSPSADS